MYIFTIYIYIYIYIYYIILSNVSYFMLYLYIVFTFFIVLYSMFFYFFDLVLLKHNFVNCLLLDMCIFVFIPIINMHTQGINVKPCYNIVYASTLCAYIAYIYDGRLNYTFLIKALRKGLLEVFKDKIEWFII